MGKKKFSLPAWLILTIISFVAAIALAVTNIGTRDIIKERAESVIKDAMAELIPEASSFETLDTQGNDKVERISVAKNENDIVGYVAQVSKPGYGGPVQVIVAVDDQLVIKGINVGGPEFKETAGLGSHVKDPAFQEQFVGKSLPLKFIKGAFGKEKSSNDTNTEAKDSENKSSSSEESTPATSGELKGEADGFGGKVIVTITKDGDKITDVKIVGEDETAGIGSSAIEKLPEKIIEKNGADVDVVAGATITSEAVIEATKQALASQSTGAKAKKASKPKKSEPSEIDGISGATVSSRAVFSAVDTALKELEKIAQ